MRASGILANGILLLVALFCGCQGPGRNPPPKRYEFQQPHMGTLFSLTLYASDAMMAQAAADAAFARVATLNAMFTDYDPESELMRLCHQPPETAVRVSAELFEILAEAQRIAALSSGAFDVTIGPVVRQWRRARRTEVLPSPAQLHRARAPVGWQKLQLAPEQRTVMLLATNMQLDLGGIAKGYAADQALAVLRERGIKRALVAASGDIAMGDPPPDQRGWRVSIGTPFQTEGTERTLLLANAAVSTSGDAEQSVVINGIRYSHIVDPRTGIGLTNRCQVSVIARRATQTDALATAVSILGAEEGCRLIKSQPKVSAIIYRETSSGIETIAVNR